MGAPLRFSLFGPLVSRGYSLSRTLDGNNDSTIALDRSADDNNNFCCRDTRCSYVKNTINGNTIKATADAAKIIPWFVCIAEQKISNIVKEDVILKGINILTKAQRHHLTCFHLVTRINLESVRTIFVVNRKADVSRIICKVM
jgi:hypothetical protein